MQLRVSLFGKLSVELSQQPLILPNACKAQELFCYLFFHFDHPQHREKLTTLLWQNVAPGQAKGYLRKAIWQLQTALTFSNQKQKSIILVDPDWISINPAFDLWLDTKEFKTIFVQTKNIPATDLNLVQLESLQKAVSLYKSELLEGFFEEWCLREREYYQLKYLNILEKLMDYYEVHQEYEAGLHYGLKILQQDEAREYTHQSIIRLYYLSGRRTEALRQYQRCCAILQAELGVQPSTRTQYLYEQIKNDQLCQTDPSAYYSPQTLSNPVQIQLSQMMSQLENIQATLSDMQDTLRHGRKQ